MQIRKRKICVVTGTRAEYGLLYWLMKEIQNDSELVLQVVVTGMHLSPEFGLTYKTIEKDGFYIDDKVDMLLTSDTPKGITKSIGAGIIGFADVIKSLKPDILVLLGDRYEILSAAIAAHIAKIPIAHIHGGETTEGQFDEAIRHSITKMALFHFVAAEPYRERVIQLGEDPKRVFNFGAIGLDNIKNFTLLKKNDLEKAINFRFGRRNFLITYHPVTLSKAGPKKAVHALLNALDQFPEAKTIFTGSNADTSGRMVNKMLETYVKENSAKAVFFTSLGQLLYLSVMKNIDVVIGNSSSGIIEAPAMKKPTVNMGDRQKGRLKAASIIDCKENTDDIVFAIKKAMSPGFQKALKNTRSPYGEGNTSLKIKEVLKTVNLKNILMKRFYNLPVKH